ncbi:hypothetical protein [Teredinibacter turnerae]|uniref:hypothetical protein n=1 Tax=Teredinibacter turnerae TaxID=2426 RepID=UPI00048F5D8E|nr:hypothetical protein [Teredinibacter turnerae]
MDIKILTLGLFSSLLLSGCSGEDGYEDEGDCRLMFPYFEGDSTSWTIDAEGTISAVDLYANTDDMVTLNYSDGSQKVFTWGGEYCEGYQSEVEATPAERLIVNGMSPVQILAHDYLYGGEASGNGSDVSPPGISYPSCEHTQEMDKQCAGTFDLNGNIFDWSQTTSERGDVPGHAITFFEMSYQDQLLLRLEMHEWQCESEVCD